MIFIVTITAFVASISTHLYSVLAAGNFDTNINNRLENFLNKKYNDNVNCESSSGGSSGTKRKREGTSKQMEGDGNEKSRPKYYYNTIPIDLITDDNIVEKLAPWERQLIEKGRTCVWKNFNHLEEKDAKDVCIEVWKIQAQEIHEIKHEDNMKPDCDTTLHPGPSKVKENFYRFIGYFRYAQELKGQPFYPDLLRCNCALLRWVKRHGIYKTVSRSKRFFYLFKHSDTVYYVLTKLGNVTSRDLLIANVRQIKVYKPIAIKPYTIPTK